MKKKGEAKAKKAKNFISYFLVLWADGTAGVSVGVMLTEKKLLREYYRYEKVAIHEITKADADNLNATLKRFGARPMVPSNKRA